MSWNEPKDKNPWQNDGNKPNNPQNQQQPPDLEEVLRKFASKINQLMGNKKPQAKPQWQVPSGIGNLFTIALISILIIYAVLGIYIVAPAERAVITQFGKYVETVGPGPHWIPRFIRSKHIVDVSQVMSSQHSGYMLTTDQNIVYLELAVQYRVEDPEAFLFNVNDPIGSLQQATDSAMRQVVGAETLERVLTSGRTEIRQKISDSITSMLQKYKSGLALVDVAMQPAKVPEPVRAAFDDVIKALEDKDRMENQAKAYSTRMVQVARGQAARYMQEAEAYRTQVESHARGEANRFNSVLQEYRKAPEVLRERLYLQSIEKVLTHTSKIVVDTKTSNNLLYLPLDQLLKNANKNMTEQSPEFTSNTTDFEQSTTPSTLSSTANTAVRNRSSR